MNFYTLKVSQIVIETVDTKTIHVDIPSSLKEVFSFYPGQYLTIRAVVDGQDIRRSYSLSTMPNLSSIGVTIKKLENGKMSTYLHDNLAVGMDLEVMPPEGHFLIRPRHDVSRDHYFFAAGSGITPIMSMIQTILEEEPRSSCYLLYGSRDETNIIFEEQLKRMVSKYQDQCHVTFVVSQPTKHKAEGFIGLLGKKSTNWVGQKGRIDGAKCMQFLYDYPGLHEDRHYYICGPGDFITTVESYLSSQEIDKKKMHKEYFSTGPKADVNVAAISGGIMVTLRGESFEVEVKKDKTILESIILLKKDPPYSCTSGACSTCMAKVTQGKVVMDSCYALDDDEIDAGYILTCQAHPASDSVAITYDID